MPKCSKPDCKNIAVYNNLCLRHGKNGDTCVQTKAVDMQVEEEGNIISSAVTNNYDDSEDEMIGEMIYNSSNTAKSRNREEAAAILLSISQIEDKTEQVVVTGEKESNSIPKEKRNNNIPMFTSRPDHTIKQNTQKQSNTSYVTEEELKFMKRIESEFGNITDFNKDDYARYFNLKNKEKRKGIKTIGQRKLDREDAVVKRNYGVNDIRRIGDGPFHYSKKLYAIAKDNSKPHNPIRKTVKWLGPIAVLPYPSEAQNEYVTQQIESDLKVKDEELKEKEEEIKRLQEQLNMSQKRQQSNEV